MSQAPAAPPAPRIMVITAESRLFEATVVPVDTVRATVQLRGEVDLGNVDLLAGVLNNQLSIGRRYVRVDLSRVTFFDCAGLTTLVHGHNDFLAARGTLVLTGVGDRIAQLLHITKLDEALLIADGPGEPARARHLRSVPAPASR